MSSRIEAARNCVSNKLCWTWQGSKEEMTTQIYYYLEASQRNKLRDGKRKNCKSCRP